jgi:hypothetical protein
MILQGALRAHHKALDQNILWDKVMLGARADRDIIVVAMGKEELERAPSWQKSER